MASTPTVRKLGPSGGIGGRAKDMNVDGITRIVKIGVSSGWTVDSIIVHFLRNGHVEKTDVFGGPGGTLEEFELEPTEYITSVKGHYGNYGNILVVRSLKFETSLGKTYGPYGREQGVPFELHAVTGQIIGFHTRSGTYLDAIGVYVKDNSTTGGSNGSGCLPLKWLGCNTKKK